LGGGEGEGEGGITYCSRITRTKYTALNNDMNR
jgi:hypothetical protein